MGNKDTAICSGEKAGHRNPHYKWPYTKQLLYLQTNCVKDKSISKAEVTSVLLNPRGKAKINEHWKQDKGRNCDISPVINWWHARQTGCTVLCRQSRRTNSSENNKKRCLPRSLLWSMCLHWSSKCPGCCSTSRYCRWKLNWLTYTTTVPQNIYTIMLIYRFICQEMHIYGSGNKVAAVLLPDFAISW